MNSLSGAIAAAPRAESTGPVIEASALDRRSTARLAPVSSHEARLLLAPAGGEDDADARGFRLGWKTSLLLTLVLLATPLGLVIALPPVLACHERAERMGFFAGETMRGCVDRGSRSA